MVFNPHTAEDRAEMLATIGIESIDELLGAIPEQILYPRLDLKPALTELEAEREMTRLASQNTVVDAENFFLGAGSYRHYIPATVNQLLLRGEIFTAYTPYQPEVAQGTLQVIYEFQSLVAELMGLDIANASLYDGATAVAEAIIMAVAASKSRHKVVLSGTLHPHYRQVVETYNHGTETSVSYLPMPTSGFKTSPADIAAAIDDQTAAVVIQYPNFYGTIEDIRGVASICAEHGASLVVATYPLPMTLLKSPGELGADIATAEGQSLGIASGFGGPYLGLLAAKERFVRLMPGRLSGMTTDETGQRGFVLTLQTREQHIRRDKATSNICTNQGLMATAATIHMSLLGKKGLREVAQTSYSNAHYLASEVGSIPGFSVANDGQFFNEFVASTPVPANHLVSEMAERGIVPGYDLGAVDPALDHSLLMATTELQSRESIDRFVAALAANANE